MRWTSTVVAVRIQTITESEPNRGYVFSPGTAVGHAGSVTTPGDLDERFRAAVAEFGASVTSGDPAAPGVVGAVQAGAASGEIDASRDGDRGDAEGAGGPAIDAERRTVRDLSEPLCDGSRLSCAEALSLFEAQLASRHLDLAARWLRSFNEGYYTIGSSGHEGNAAVAGALRATDPALLHYRSGAFYLVRAAQAGRDQADALRDVLRGLVASAREPIAGGRHKVFGHRDLAVIPTTSTIASHLPRAVGVGFAISRLAEATSAPQYGEPEPAEWTAGGWPPDAVAVCSFGDASVNQAAATSALNAAGWATYRGYDLPVLFVCEDNGIGVSVKSPDGWVADVLRSRPGLHYLAADGCDLVEAYEAAVTAAGWVRENRRPAVLHLATVRLMGHAGADAEVAYRTSAEIAKDAQRDPLLRSAELLINAGVVDADGVLARYEEIGWKVRSIAEEVITEPKLRTAAEVIAPLAPRRSARVAQAIERVATWASGRPEARVSAFNGKLPEDGGPVTLAQSINATLTDALLAWPQAVLFGEDVAVKGGVYGVTKGLRDRFGDRRVFDTLLDETSILGLALGVGLAGALPIPEIQYLAYLHTAEDQLRGEAATMQFFSVGAYRNPLVVRVAGLAYQEGFGGHFHNDNAIGVLRDVPGLVVACPARPDDAAALLRTCLAAAATDGTVCAYLEPIALYHTRDLLADGDRGWLARYPAPADWAAAHAPIGRARVDIVGSGEDLTIITFGNGVRMSLKAADALAAEGVGCRVVDLRWLAPLPVADIIQEAAATGRVLIADETRRSGGVGEGVLAALVDAGFIGVARRVAGIDTFVPLGPAAHHVLISPETIVEGARGLLGR
jgi:2-oxoisovalerate dehydrogenase E1 component